MMRKQRSYKDEGTLAHYVVYLLPEGRYWTNKVRGEFRQIHQCARDGGRYIQTDGAGYLQEDPALFDQLNGVSPGLFHRTLDYMAQDAKMAKNSRAIGIVQYHEAFLTDRTLEQTALDNGMSYRTLHRQFWEGIDLLRSLLRGEKVSISEDYRVTA